MQQVRTGLSPCRDSRQGGDTRGPCGRPGTFKAVPYKGAEYAGMDYIIQVAPEDCTGCSLCVMVCPAKDKANPKHKALELMPQRPLRDAERENYAFFLDLPEVDRTTVKTDIKSTQFLEPLFEYSGACAGCGETPYIKLLTQLYGDHLLIANANRLLIHLRRQFADDAVHGESGWTRTRLGKLVV